MFVKEFLRNYDIKLGEMGRAEESSPKLTRDDKGFAALPTEDDFEIPEDIEDIPESEPGKRNIKLYRENGIDELFKAATELPLNHVEENEYGNVFADSLFRPTVKNENNTGYYSAYREEQANVISELLLVNSTGNEECEDLLDEGAYEGGLSKSQFEELTECYMNRVFNFLAVKGLTRSFPVYTEPGGTVVPVFDFLPQNTGSDFSVIFLTALIAAPDPKVFVLNEFSVESGLERKSRFEWKKTYTWGKDEEKPQELKDLESVFNPKATVIGEEESISFNEKDETSGSAGAVIFEANVEPPTGTGGEFYDRETKFEPKTTAEIAFAKPENRQVVELELELGKTAYIKESADPVLIHDFQLEDGEFTNPFGIFSESFEDGGTVYYDAILNALTVDNEEIEVSLTDSGISGEVETPSELKAIFESKVESGYINFFIEGDDKLKVGGDLAFIGYDSAAGSGLGSQRRSLPDPIVAVFNAGVYVFEKPVESIENTGGLEFENVKNKKVYQRAPFFESESKEREKTWTFVSKEVAARPFEDLSSIGIKANEFDPELGPSDAEDGIIEKAVNGVFDEKPKYKGFNSNVFNYDTKSREDVDESLLEDFFTFYVNYIEENFQVLHVGLDTSAPPVPKVVGPADISVTLDTDSPTP